MEDAIYAVAPNIRQIKDNNWDFIISAKPEGNKYIFKLWETRKRLNERITYHTFKEKEINYEFSYLSNVCLNGTNTDIKVNFLHCKQTDKKGKATIFS